MYLLAMSSNLLAVIGIPLVGFEAICLTLMEQALVADLILLSSSTQIEAFLRGRRVGIDRSQVDWLLTLWVIHGVKSSLLLFGIELVLPGVAVNAELGGAVVGRRISVDLLNTWHVVAVVEALTHVALLTRVIVGGLQVLRTLLCLPQLCNG